MVSYTQVQQELRKWLSPLRLRLIAGEAKQLPQILWQDEVIESAAQGWYKGGLVLLVATNRRLILVDHKWLDTKVDDFPYSRISTIEHDCNNWMGKIVVIMPGTTLEVHRISADVVKNFANVLMDHVTREPKPKEQPVNNLQILAFMLDKGILTDEEFKAQWKQLIGATSNEKTFLDYPTQTN